jgi:hypothetical protein
MDEIGQLDRAVLEFMLNRNGAVYSQLRDQIPLLKSAGREMSGVGYFAYFRPSGEAKPASDRINIEISDVGGTTPDLKHGVGFILFVRDGLIEMLEGFTVGDEDWPLNEDNIRIRSTQFALDTLK